MREKRCAVCVPPALGADALPPTCPPSSPDDLRGYLELRAEREFPVALERTAPRPFCPTRCPTAQRRATLAALPARAWRPSRSMLAAAGGRRLVDFARARGTLADGATRADAAFPLGRAGTRT